MIRPDFQRGFDAPSFANILIDKNWFGIEFDLVISGYFRKRAS